MSSAAEQEAVEKAVHEAVQEHAVEQRPTVNTVNGSPDGRRGENGRLPGPAVWPGSPTPLGARFSVGHSAREGVPGTKLSRSETEPPQPPVSNLSVR